MKTFYIFITLLTVLYQQAFSQNRSSLQAEQEAIVFLRSQSSPHISDESEPLRMASMHRLQLAYAAVDFTEQPTVDTLLYIFSAPEGPGFVVVSADERMDLILGYSEHGHFDAQQIPDNFRFWLSIYEAEARWLKLDPSPESNRKSPVIKDDAPISPIAPLLGSIKWNQSAPYNNLCPIIDKDNGTRAVTGCVATGMAMVMKYYEWPVRGKGSNSYTTSTLKIPLNVDFSQTTYDWSNMTPGYNSASTAAERLAVATLMYHAGVAVDMNYNISSGALVSKMGQGLIKHFDYDQNLQLYSRDYYQRSEWIQLLHQELQASRPVLYSGAAKQEAGHLWVCDGVDANGFFHFNWGWGGMSDGYFRITSLHPGSLGIGGGSGGYDYYQGITIGIQPPNPNSRPVYQMIMNESMSMSTTTTTTSGTITVTANRLFNTGINTFGGSISLLAYSSSGTFVKNLRAYNVSSLAPNYGWNTLNFDNVSFSGMAEGNYLLYVAHQPTGSSEIFVVRGKVGVPHFLSVNITGSQVTIAQPSEPRPALALRSLTTEGQLYTTKTGRFVAEVQNNGAEYNSDLVIQLTSVSDPSVSQQVNVVPCNLIQGEIRSFNMKGKITLQPGSYYAAILYDQRNVYTNVNYQQLGDAIIVEVLPEPTGSPVLQLGAPISFPDNERVPTGNAVLRTSVTNTGAYFEGKIIAFIFPPAGGQSLTYIGYQDAIFDAGEQVDLRFHGNINLPPGEYQIAAYYQLNAQWNRMLPEASSILRFILVEGDATGLENLDDHFSTIYPNPATDYLIFAAETPVESLRIFDTSGIVVFQQVNMNGRQHQINIQHFSPGVYVLQFTTLEGSVMRKKFIKQ